MEGNMIGIAKKATAVLCSVVLAATALGLVVGANIDTAYAEENRGEPIKAKIPMKSLGLKWNLKKNKTVKMKTRYLNAGYHDTSLKVTNWKNLKAKKGYKKVSFKLTFTNDYKLTQKQIRNLTGSPDNYCDIVFGHAWFAVVDYNTGRSLAVKNNKKVTVKQTKWKYTGQKTYNAGSMGKMKLYKTASATVTITFPKSYKGLCLGVGGYNVPYPRMWYQGIPQYDKIDWFWDGEASFGQTTLYNWKLANKGWSSGYNTKTCYTKSKTNSHWMRIQ